MDGMRRNAGLIAVGALVLASCTPSVTPQAVAPGTLAQVSQLGAFDCAQDIGAPALAGASIHLGGGSYRITGGGANI